MFNYNACWQMLCDQDAWNCPDCKKFQPATKTMEIWARPEILVVHFKRFRSHGRFGEKIDDEIYYPIEACILP